MRSSPASAFAGGRRSREAVGAGEAGCCDEAGDRARLHRELRGVWGAQSLAADAARRLCCRTADGRPRPSRRHPRQARPRHGAGQDDSMPARPCDPGVHAPAPNRLRLSDFTYVSTWSGFVYLAFVTDAYARRIVGWRVSRTAHASFVLDALEQAMHERRPHQAAGGPHEAEPQPCLRRPGL